jgi:hypothetical protein
MSLSDWFRKQLELDAESAIELGLQEKIIHVTGRHYIVLLRRLIVPVFLLICFAGVALFRAAGGALFALDAAPPGDLDLLNWVLIVLMGLLLALMFVWARNKKGGALAGPVLTLGIPIGLLAGLVVFRYGGGRVFDLAGLPDQGLDLLNLGLMLLAALALGAIAFTVYDWLNDELIVTNQRVVYDNDQVIIPRLIEQRVQQQIFLEDVQNVAATTKTYPQHLLGYGTVEVASARFNGNIRFEEARDPKKMQEAIMGQVRALKKSLTEQNYGRLVGERVYGLKAPSNRPALKATQSQGWLWLRKIVPVNPEVNESTGQYTWRRHWLFLMIELLEPFAVLIGGGVLVVLGVNLGLLTPLWLALAIFLLVLYVGLRSAWKVLDYQNDLYILAPDKVIDIEKKPFGPEDRREANLSQVNNISSKTTYLSNFLGYGDVVLTTGGSGGGFTFTQVPRPGEVVNLITEYNVRAQQANKDRALNDTLELLKYYHEAQLQRDEINRPQAQA